MPTDKKGETKHATNHVTGCWPPWFSVPTILQTGAGKLLQRLQSQAIVPQAIVPQAIVPQAIVPQAIAPQATVPQGVGMADRV